MKQNLIFRQIQKQIKNEQIIIFLYFFFFLFTDISILEGWLSFITNHKEFVRHQFFNVFHTESVVFFKTPGGEDHNNKMFYTLIFIIYSFDKICLYTFQATTANLQLNPKSNQHHLCFWISSFQNSSIQYSKICP